MKSIIIRERKKRRNKNLGHLIHYKKKVSTGKGKLKEEEGKLKEKGKTLEDIALNLEKRHK